MAIIGKGGAEHLTGNGAMLIKSSTLPDYTFAQGSYMPKDDLRLALQQFPFEPYEGRRKFIVPAYDHNHDTLNEIEDLKRELSGINADNRMRARKAKEDMELALIIEWTLTQQEISVYKIQKTFRMGNRASEIMDRLYKLDIVGDKFAKQPRAVLVQAAEELSEEAKHILSLAN